MNYEISRTVSRIVEPTGTIKKLSVAVLVDGTYEGGKAGEATSDQPKKYVARSEEEMKRIEDIVKKAMGYHPNGRIKSKWSASSSASESRNR